MQKIQSRAAVVACFASVLFASPAFSFETVDTIFWPSRGRFPAAYPPEAARPTDFFVEAGVMHDDNLIRTQSIRFHDTVGRLGAGIRHLQRIIGRESLLIDARVAGYGFAEFDSLNHVAYSAAGTWLWEAMNELTGTVTAGRDSRLVDIGERQSGVREILTLTRMGASAAFTPGPSFRFTGGADLGLGESDLRPDVKLRTAGWRAGASYVTPLANTLGVEYRKTHGDAPVPEFVAPAGTFANNSFDEKEIAAVATYATRDRATFLVDMRLGRTERLYSEIPNRDFKGTTYRIAGEYGFTPRVLLDFFVYKEPRSIIDVGASHLLVKGVMMGPRYAFSAKTVFGLRWVHERRVGQGNPAVIDPAFPLRDELINTMRFSIGWEPERHWQVGLGFDRGVRYSNAVGRSYHYDAFIANVGYHY